MNGRGTRVALGEIIVLFSSVFSCLIRNSEQETVPTQDWCLEAFGWTCLYSVVSSKEKDRRRTRAHSRSQGPLTEDGDCMNSDLGVD